MRKIYKIMIMVLVLLLGGAAVARIVQLNNKYPPATLEKYQLNEKLDYAGVEFMVTDFQLVNEEDIPAITPIDGDESLGEKKYMIITAKISNQSNKIKEVDLTPIKLESVAFTNAIDMGALIQMSSGKPTLHPTLYPNEEIEMQLPFAMSEVMFTEEDWKNINERDFQVVFSLYPVKKVVELKKNTVNNS